MTPRDRERTARERGVLFTGEMVRRLPGIEPDPAKWKTQTRRVITTPIPEDADEVFAWFAGQERLAWLGNIAPEGLWARSNAGIDGWIRFLARCPYGAPGDRLYVREKWAPLYGQTPSGPFTGMRRVERVVYYADGVDKPFGGDPYKWRPSIHMPRWASRITLELTEVRVERVQDISEEDARAEGCHGFDSEPVNEGGTVYAWKGRSAAPSPRAHFATLWDRINGPRGHGWEANPWVWCLTFKRLEV